MTQHPLAPLWTRGSPEYTALAGQLLTAMARVFDRAELGFAGSQDGEAALGLDADGTLVFLRHLEDPDTAIELAAAIAHTDLEAYLRWQWAYERDAAARVNDDT